MNKQINKNFNFNNSNDFINTLFFTHQIYWENLNVTILTYLLIFKHKYGFIKKIINNVRNTRC